MAPRFGTRWIVSRLVSRAQRTDLTLGVTFAPLGASVSSAHGRQARECGRGAERIERDARAPHRGGNQSAFRNGDTIYKAGDEYPGQFAALRRVSDQVLAIAGG